MALAELGVAFKKNGGDYLFLSKLVHPKLGYLSAWASFIVAFTTPITISALAIIKYSEFLHWPYPKLWASLLIVVITIIHSFSLKRSEKFQDASTLIKIGFILILIVIGFLYMPKTNSALLFSSSWKNELPTPSFATSMIYVFYAFSGWSSAAYIAGEIANPKKALPIAILGGTLFVTIIYILLQVVMLRQGSLTEMEGRENVTAIAFSHILSGWGLKTLNLFIGIQLIATISSYLWIGSRITFAMAQDQEKWRLLRITNRNNIPVYALWANASISVFYLNLASLDQALKGPGFIMQSFAIFVVYSSLKLKGPTDFKTPFKPFPQLIFISFSVYILINNLLSNPVLNLIWLGVIVSGLIFYKKPKQLTTPIIEDYN
jgi:basic amino acid/polyamine antiporter, APA family